MNNKIDKSDLKKVIVSTPNQFKEGFEIVKDVDVDANFSKIVISGMGGSALPADVLKCYLYDIFEGNRNSDIVEVYQNRTYKLPVESYTDCLNIICSHSGNTEETISSFKEAIENNLPCIGISAGGEVEQICLENNISHIKLPVPFENFQPRMATGHFVSVLIGILIKAGKINDDREFIINTSVKFLKKNIEDTEQYGETLAKILVNKTPLIYASDKFKSLAMIWKIKINENSKVPAFWNYFPELNHNEFVGFSLPQAKFHCIMLKDNDDHKRNILRYSATAKALEIKGIETTEIILKGENVLEKLFSTITLCDWMSYYLALEYGQDPTPVDMVEDFKKTLG
jgi:glucose/mannose-6-phosphate isomerase